MLIYEDETVTREDLDRLRRRARCKVCGGRLNVFLDMDKGKAFLACNDWNRTHHDGISREASRYETGGLSELTIKARREIMTKEYGEAKTKALAKYTGVVSLTKPEAKEILNLVYPKAPDTEITRAVALCASYGLNPLMNHVFLIPFATKGGGQSWATVIGIKAKRLLASRRGNYSYVDNTPRVMTKEEQVAIFGEENTTHLSVITRLKDPGTGAEAVGYGTWPNGTEPFGTDKGNSKFNMAAIRSESQALDRLRPGEMPMGVDVIPEEFIEGEYEVKEELEPELKEVADEARVIKEGLDYQAEPKEHWCKEHNCPFEKKRGPGGTSFYSHKLPGGSWCNEGKKKDTAPMPEPEPELEPDPERIGSELAEEAGLTEPEPEPKAKDERPVSQAEIAQLKKLCDDTGMDTKDLGKYIRDEKHWEGINSFKDLKKWQHNELLSAFEKGRQ